MQELVSPWCGGKRVVDVALLKGGLMNRNIRVRLDGPPHVCVLRLYDANPAACAKEIAVLERIAVDVPVPTVLYANLAGDGDEPPFVVMSEVEGISLFALRQTGDAVALGDACFDAGRVLARIGNVSASSLAPNIATLAPIDYASPALQQRLGADTCDRLQRFVCDRAGRIADIGASSGLVHGDYNSANVFVRRSGDVWRVSAILDWEFALAGSSYFDIGNFLRYHRRLRPRYEPDFSRGLRDGGMWLPGDWLAVARLADLPACCELLSRPRVPDIVIREVEELILATLDERDIG